jgi:ubiquinone/menaquinone biosynthesis C-methylase UbiE
MRILAGSLTLAGVLALASAAPAQVAQQANSGYQTEEQRKAVAKTLADPNREETQRPGVLVRDMRLKPGMTVADVGTGIGYMLPFLSKAVGPTGQVIAEDIFDDFLESAKQRALGANLANVTFVKGATTDAKLPEGKADVVLALDVYHHFDYPDKMLASIAKGLKPDGRLIIVDYYKRPEAMANGRAMTHIRLDMPDVIKEVEANGFHLVSEKEHIKNVQYMLMLEKK